MPSTIVNNYAAEQRIALTFQLEREIVGQMPTLVVPPQEEQGVWIPHLQGPQVQHTLIKTISEALKGSTGATNLDTEVPSVDVVTQEEVSRVRWTATKLKQLHKVVLGIHIPSTK